MTVSAEQLAEAVSFCRSQMARTAFDDAAFAVRGWPKVIWIEPTAADPSALRTYRHPDNMLLITLFDKDPNKPDFCSVRTPFGPDMQATTMRDTVATAEASMWSKVSIETQGAVGGLATFTRKERK